MASPCSEHERATAAAIAAWSKQRINMPYTNYHIGEVGKPTDIAHFSNTSDNLFAVARLKPHDHCFVLRSNGIFSFAKVLSREGGRNAKIELLVSETGIKVIPMQHFCKYIRVLKSSALAVQQRKNQKHQEQHQHQQQQQLLKKRNSMPDHPSPAVSTKTWPMQQRQHPRRSSETMSHQHRSSFTSSSNMDPSASEGEGGQCAKQSSKNTIGMHHYVSVNHFSSADSETSSHAEQKGGHYLPPRRQHNAGSFHMSFHDSINLGATASSSSKVSVPSLQRRSNDFHQSDMNIGATPSSKDHSLPPLQRRDFFPRRTRMKNNSIHSSLYSDMNRRQQIDSPPFETSRVHHQPDVANISSRKSGGYNRRGSSNLHCSIQTFFGEEDNDTKPLQRASFATSELSSVESDSDSASESSDDEESTSSVDSSVDALHAPSSDKEEIGSGPETEPESGSDFEAADDAAFTSALRRPSSTSDVNFATTTFSSHTGRRSSYHVGMTSRDVNDMKSRNIHLSPKRVAVDTVQFNEKSLLAAFRSIHAHGT